MRLAFGKRQGRGIREAAIVALVALAICGGASAARKPSEGTDAEPDERAGVKSDVLGIATL
jgi:hypothetical protein